jgi:hypothetical protein
MANNLATAAEIEFLRKLGTHKLRSGTPKRVEDVPRATRLSLLLGYARGTGRRVNWGSINRVTVEMEVEQLIAQLA